DDKGQLTAVRDRIRAELGAAFQVDTGKDLAKKQSAQFKPILDGINNVLLAFAGVALLVGVFLILNTFSIIVAQRTKELALLRAMGASRRQVIGSVLVEAVMIGLIAAVLGLAAGIGAGAGLAALFGSFADLTLASIG